MRRSEAGFSLLEVMAAVAVVAIVFTTLARVASEGLYSEGLSKRRLEASLLADRAIADVELGAAAGAVPTPGLTEVEEGLYHIAIEVRPFDVLKILPEPVDPATGLPRREAEEEVEPVWVQEVKVTVRWPEGFDEGAVRRTTYTVNLSDLAGEGGELALPAGPQGVALPGGPS